MARSRGRVRQRENDHSRKFVSHLLDTCDGQRRVVAIAGPPGSGKTTLADRRELDLNTRTPGYAAVFSMGGFHYDDPVLTARGIRSRKGALETFDVDGSIQVLGRLRSNKRPGVSVPVFDRSLEISRAAARIIRQSVRLVIVEGNYLLLGRPGWNDLHFDTSVMLTVSREILRQRLVDRWQQHGKTSEEILVQVDFNDIANVDIVQKNARFADFCILEA